MCPIIIPVFIPGGCTDEFQVCDIAVNKPYKTEIDIELETESYTSALSDESESDEEPEQVINARTSGRSRVANSMIGSVKRGKYSR